MPEKSQGGNNSGSDMELDECNEEMSEDEDEFDVNRTITEAEAYLKENPITFVPPSLPSCRTEASADNAATNNDKQSCGGSADDSSKVTNKVTQLPSGLMSEEDLPSSDEDDDEEQAATFTASAASMGSEMADDRLTTMSTDVQTGVQQHGVENIYGKRTINGEVCYSTRLLSRVNRFLSV